MSSFRVEKLPETGELGLICRIINRLSAEVYALRPAPAPGILTNRTNSGVSRRPTLVPKQTTAGATVVQFEVKEMFEDYFTAYRYTSTARGAVENIAKPVKLRKSPWAGGGLIPIVLEDGTSTPPTGTVAYQYLTSTYRVATITVGTAITTENQVIIPQYRIGDIIYAIEPENGTLVDDPFLEDVTWLDLNVDGRAWSKVV